MSNEVNILLFALGIMGVVYLVGIVWIKLTDATSRMKEAIAPTETDPYDRYWHDPPS